MYRHKSFLEYNQILFLYGFLIFKKKNLNTVTYTIFY